MKVSVIIPVYNEQETLKEIIRRVDAVPLDKEIIVVDDCSTDESRSILNQTSSIPHLRVLYHEKNMGKGAALRTGFAVAKGEILIVQDADLETDPRDYPKLIEPILKGEAEVVYGTRFHKHTDKKEISGAHYLANQFLTGLSNCLTRLNLSDMETCYKVFRRDIVAGIRIEENRFGFEPEITAKMARLGCRVAEVPISYTPRTAKEGKKIGWRDGLQAIWCILKYSLRPSVAVTKANRETEIHPFFQQPALTSPPRPDNQRTVLLS